MVLAIAMAGCGTPCRTAQEPPVAAIRATAARFIALHGRHLTPTVRAEATRLARTAERQARVLACQYGVCPPARFHNLLVNLHLKKRGLCWHYPKKENEKLAKARQVT